MGYANSESDSCSTITSALNLVIGRRQIHREERHPRVRSCENTDGTVSITVFTPGLEKGSTRHSPRNGDVHFWWINNHGFWLQVIVRDDMNNKETSFFRKVRQFPSEINIQKSYWKVKNGEIAIKVTKADNSCWRPLLWSKGLDQYTSDEDV
ncbi:uncharacterized protein LOC131931996 [Physella acuta]|uniref:uncharacterized protein LOC131931996 n=1 Tax=Physella acuta TaxID=109671 RepID=UPI0027DB96B7|nr:uncharacterized protein LOC131931996 [Physella acuta]